MSDLSELTVQAIEPERLERLRQRAASLLTGRAATKGSTARAADALSVLHTLASSPDTASDALTLLHELQVHQVELDLQAQELRESGAELEAALRHQIELYDHLPVACFTVDHRLNLQETNQTGADMLGIGRDDVQGLPLEAFVCADSAHRLRQALSGLDDRRCQPSCLLTLCPRDGSERQVLASVAAGPVAERFLVSFMNAENEAI